MTTAGDNEFTLIVGARLEPALPADPPLRKYRLVGCAAHDEPSFLFLFSPHFFLELYNIYDALNMRRSTSDCRRRTLSHLEFSACAAGHNGNACRLYFF